jgi:hypothetical protein
MLQDAVDYGTGSAVRRVGFRGPAAGKTGTTNDGTDVWFVGYTPRHVASVWIGFDDPEEVVGDASGGRIAAPIWGRVMRRMYASRKMPAAWKAPESIVKRTVDPVTGFVIAQGCKPQRGKPRREMFLSYAQPATTCPSGQPTKEPGFFDRAFAFLRSAWHDVKQWVKSHVGREDDRDDRGDRYLGVPKLPEAVEVPQPMLDSMQIIELDTMPMVPDTIVFDTLPADTFVLDTFPVDTFPVDTLSVPDTLRTDTSLTTWLRPGAPTRLDDQRPEERSRAVAATRAFLKAGGDANGIAGEVFASRGLRRRPTREYTMPGADSS